MNIRNSKSLLLIVMILTGCAAPQSIPAAEPTTESAKLCPSFSIEGITVTLPANDYVMAYTPTELLVTVQTDASCMYTVTHTESLAQQHEELVGENNQFAQPENDVADRFTHAAIQACFLPETLENSQIETMLFSYYVDCSGFSRPEFITSVEALFIHNVQVHIWSPTNDRVSSVDGALFEAGEIVILLGNSVTEFTIADVDFPEQTYQFAADSVIFSYP